jgi:pimeloyl-ACP methyl ester carboxylesterase
LIHLLVWALAIVVFGAVAGAIYQVRGLRRDASLHPAPGRLVSVGTHRLHVLESGTGAPGQPTIVLEAGLMSTVLSWYTLQPQLARTYRVVSYDRAGLGWSDLGPMPRTAERIADELHTLLGRAEISPPYVLVGHSFGGLTMPLFAARFPDDVRGMVLIDAVVPAEWDPPSERDRRMSTIGAKVCRRAAVLARIGLLRFVAYLLTSGIKKPGALLVRLISRGTPADSGTVSSPWYSALPAEERAMTPVFWIQSKFALTIASQLENLPRSAGQARAPGPVSDKPVILLSARTSSQLRREEHRRIASNLAHGEHIVVEDSNHWIMQENPQLVVDAIARVMGWFEQHPPRSTPAAAYSSHVPNDSEARTR